MKTTFETSSAAVVEKSQDRPPPHTPHPPPAIPAPSHPSRHRHLSPPSLQHLSHPLQRSRSLRRRSEPPEIDKRPLSIHRSPRRHKTSARRRRNSPRDFSPPRDRGQSRARRGRERSITLKSASPLRRGRHHDHDQDKPVHSNDVSSRPPKPGEPPRWQQHTTKEDYYHRGHRQQDPSQWQDWGDWGKWQATTSNDQSSWPSQKPGHSHSTTHQHSTWDNSHSHSHRPAARLSAAPHSKPLRAFSASAQPHQWSKNRHPRSDTGDQSRWNVINTGWPHADIPS